MAHARKYKFQEWSCCKRGKKPYNPHHSKYSPAPRTWYQRDIDQIIYSTVFRKMQRKSQLLPPEATRHRTRLVHTLEVARIAREMSHRLRLDTALTEAIAFGHDLANSAYGAAGNQILKELTGNSNDIQFKHEEAGVLMVQTLAARQLKENDEIGMCRNILRGSQSNKEAFWKWEKCPFNLYLGKEDEKYYEYIITPEVLDGIESHNSGKPATLEGQIVQIADNFAYISQDLEDLLLVGLLKENRLVDYKANNSLTLIGKTYSWEQINEFYPGVDAKKILSSISGERVGALIERLVEYNLRKLKTGEEFISQYSYILEIETPVLEVDEGMKFLTDFIWKEIIEPNYEETYIKVANELQRCEIIQLFEVLRNTEIIEKNQSLHTFLLSLNNSRFNSNTNEWKIAYLISHLSWDEIKMILSRYQQKDYSFGVDIGSNVIYN